MGRTQLNNMVNEEDAEDWALSTVCWYAVFIWFGASLFSQSLYMALNGEPYNANMILESAGPFAWILIAIEILVWGVVILFFSRKVIHRFKDNPAEIGYSDNPSPQS